MALTSPRISTTLIPVQVTGRRDLPLDTTGRIVDVSSSGLCIGLSEPVSVGSFLRLGFDDSTIFGEVRYCEDQGAWYAVGLFVEEMLIGASEVARSLAALIAETDAAEREVIRFEALP